MLRFLALRLFVFLAIVAGVSISTAAEATLTPAFTFADIDTAQSGLVSQMPRLPLDEAMFKLHFQAIPRKLPVHYEPVRAGSQFVLIFRDPVALGTALLGAGETGTIGVQTLRSDFKGSMEKAVDGDWREAADVETFAPDFRTRAVRFVLNRDQQSPFTWLAWKERLTNLTPTAVGSGEKAPFGSHPNSIPLGRTWLNTDRDPQPGSPKQLQRGPISEALPSWYLLSWDTPQAIASLWLSCNADLFTVYAYRGELGLNPAIAPSESWRRIDFQTLHEQLRDGDRLHDRLLAFDSLKTIAIKVVMTGCKRGAVAKVANMTAFTASSARNADIAAAGSEGKAISFEQPFDGQVAVVVTDEAGRTVRNLVAQVDRKRGPNVERWDLKNEAGLTVPPGKYRWKAITSPPIGVRYQTAVYPNAPQLFPGRTPWLTGESGANGWLADHASITSGAACGERVFFGAPGVESGVALIECDFTGNKLWGKHSFGPFSGVGRLAGDSQTVYIQERDSLHRLDPQTHKIERIASLTSPERQGQLVGMAAHEGTLALSLNAPEPWLENATRADVVDLENCLPKFAAKVSDPLGTRRVEPLPRIDFLRLLRLTGTPAGQGAAPEGRREMHFPITLDTVGEGKYQYVVLAFLEAVPLGSVVLPNLGAEYLVDLAVHKPNAPYPPNPHDDSQWQAAEKPRTGSWTCVAMPPQVRTRGLRIRVRRAKDAGEDNLIDDILSAPSNKKKGPSEFDLDKPATPGESPKLVEGPAAAKWFASFEGLKLLRRRFADLTPQAKIRINSGEINPAGEWNAQRTEPLSTEDPGIYVMQWPQATKLTGLAIKEIDGAVTEIDIWDESVGGVAGKDVPLADSPGWKHVGTYKQSRRDGYHPAFERNDWARYLDGYFSLGGEVATRAVRLRVTSQWADLTDRGTATVRIDRGGRELDRRRCSIYGVAALGYLGEEAPLDTLAYRRIELRDSTTGKLRSEFTAHDGSGLSSESPLSLAYRADGVLFGIQQNRVVNIDPKTGVTHAELPEIDGRNATAHRLAIGPDGSFYVYVLPDKNVRVFNREGIRQRTIGKPGGQVPGPWDAEKFLQVEELVVDAKNQLWVVESQDVPRRIVQYNAVGKLLREFYGNTHYGGGGVLDSGDKTRLFYQHIEFALDWNTGASRIKNMLAEWMPEDCVPIRYKDRIYLAKTPLSHNATQPAAMVYLYDPERGTANLVAAFGEADAFEPLQASSVLKKLEAGKSPKDYTFTWSDRDGDSQVDPVEVVFEAKTPGAARQKLGRINSQLRCWAGARIYTPKSILPNGVPLYEASPADRSGVYELNDSTLLSLGVPAESALPTGDGNQLENHAVDPQGKPLWRYPVSYPSVSGLYLPPWEAGYVTNEFGIIGHEVATAGELGEFVVIHGNNGMWKIWTADGLLAGQILRHKLDPRSTVDTSRSTVERGQAFDNMTAGQEHFHGYFTKASDGKYYIVHGHNYIGLWEVLGLDQFQRLSGEITVTPADARSVRQRQEELARREVKSQAKVLECLRVKSGGEIPRAAELEGVQFAIGYDEQSLYVRWNVSSPHGALRNSGEDFHRYFKTGACLDLQLGTDESAPANRNTPVAGDVRLLFTVVNGKPKAVLYQPISAGANAKDAWETRTDAGGTTRFDRVVQLTNAQLDYAPDRTNPNDRYSFTAVIPLRELNWKPRPEKLFRCDWGLLTSDDGHTVKRRIYWSNVLATGTTDEAWEARLDPRLWGTLLVTETSRAQRQAEQMSPGGKAKPSASSDIVDDILNSLDAKKK